MQCPRPGPVDLPLPASRTSSARHILITVMAIPSSAIVPYAYCSPVTSSQPPSPNDLIKTSTRQSQLPLGAGSGSRRHSSDSGCSSASSCPLGYRAARVRHRTGASASSLPRHSRSSNFRAGVRRADACARDLEHDPDRHVGGALDGACYTAIGFATHRPQRRLVARRRLPRARPARRAGTLAGLAFLWVFLFFPPLTPLRTTLFSMWLAYRSCGSRTACG